MDLHYLRIFYEVAKEQSFTKAAENLFINQSAVSIQIKKFEDTLNVKLIDRAAKKIKLTYAGEVLYKTSEEIFQKVKRVEKEIEKVILYEKGKIIIGATHIIGEPILPKILKGFSVLYEGMEIEIHIQERDILFELLKEGKIDLILMGDYYLNDKNLKIIPINNYPFTLVYKEKLRSLKQLEDITLISRSDSIILSKKIAHIENMYDITIKKRIVVNGSVETVKNLVIEGLGFTILPYYSVYKEIETGELKVVDDFEDFKTGYQIVFTVDKKDNAEIKKFVEYVKQFKIEGEI